MNLDFVLGVSLAFMAFILLLASVTAWLNIIYRSRETIARLVTDKPRSERD